MQLLVLGAEALFVVVFAATLLAWLRHRDPVRRDVTLVFAPLAILFLVEVWRVASDGQPLPVLLAKGTTVLYVLQPLFTLHLVSLVRHVPRRVLLGAAALSLGTGTPLVLLPSPGPAGLTLAAFVALIVNQLIAAGLLFGEARRRRGPGAARFGLAALSTALFASALLAGLVVGLLPAPVPGIDLAELSRAVTGVLGIVAALGYLVAFVPPRPIRALWQAGTALDYGRELVANGEEPVAATWARFAGVASVVTGAPTTILVATDDGGAEIAASARLDVPAGLTVAADDLEALRQAAPRGDIALQGCGDAARRLAEAAGARFIQVVPFPADPGGGAVVILAPYRSLFHASDAELLATLGAQTAMEAQRRRIVAEQEALAQQLAATNEVLASASQAKSDFLASMSHELRTPLSAILGFSDLMRNEPATGDDVTVPREWVELIHRGGEHLLSLINDVLDLAKVEAGRLELQLEQVEVGASVRELLNGLRPLADRKHLRLEADIEALTIEVDRGRLRQVLYNLLSNAIKYTPAGGSVRVVARSLERWVEIAVIDTGVGIAPEDQALVFEEFRQVGDARERQEGTGLGLALTRRLVEAHGGRISVESTRGAGSTFRVLLPGSEARDTVAAGGPRLVRAGGSVTSGTPGDVLVIEDAPGAVRLLREYLESAGYRLRIATDGEAGILMAEAQAPSAIVLDILLPGIDGWEVLRRLKASAVLRDIPVVIVTVVDERQVGMALGAVDYLVKPVGREALVAALNRYAPPTPEPHRAPRVLVVDDEDAGRRLIQAMLQPDGVEVLHARGGREALERLRHESVDLVVCDLVMPGMDGFEVVAALKADRRTAATPIVVCTAHDLSAADKARLNGKILAIVSKGDDARDGLRRWLARVAPVRPLAADAR